MRPNVNSGCSTLENAASLAPVRNLPPYPLPPPTPAHLHVNLHQHQQQAAQQQNPHIRHQQSFHAQQHLVQQQQQVYKLQGPNHWLTPHFNAGVPHQTTANKHGIGRHQSLQQPHLRMPPAHQQHQYQQYLSSLQPQPQNQPSRPPHHFNVYNPANPPRTIPEQLSVASSATSQAHPHNFTKLPPSTMVNQQLIHECAGIPLISNASTHLTAAQRQRVQRKLSRSPAPHPKLPPVGGGDGGVEQAYNLHHSGAYIARNSNTASCTQISQLAVHAQGVPLLQYKQHQKQLQPQQSVGQNWSMSKNGSNCIPTTAVVKSTEKPIRSTLRYQHSAPAVLNSRGKENNTTSTEEHATSEASKDNAESGETALPRIIKPRKRRKKDRKPINNGIFLKLDALSNSGSTLAQKDNIKAGQAAGVETTSHTELMRRQPQQLQPQSHWYAPDDANENLYKFINFYIGNAQSMNCAAGGRFIDSKSAYQDCKPKGLLQSSCLKSLVVVNAAKNTQDEHGLCFCHNCDPLRSIWDYPLRRSLSDSSTASERTHSSTSSSSASSTTSSSPSHASAAETSISSPSPSTPLTDVALSPTSALSRANRVGVIGSNRNVLDSKRDVTKRNADINICDAFGVKSAANGCLSDSNDSGYGDILGGINIADDFFSQNSYNNTAALAMPPLFDTAELMLNVDPFETKISKLYSSADNSLLPLLPATADALLTESINEISRKLIETCGSELPSELACSTARSTSSYSRCSSDLSADSGIDSAAILNCDDLVFKFDNLNFILDSAEKKNLYANNNKENNNSSGSGNNNTATLERGATNMFANLLQLPAMAATATATATAPKTGTPTAGDEESFLIDAANINLQFDVNNNGNKSIFEFESENKRSQAVQENHHLQQQQLQQQNQQFINNCFDLVWPTTFEHCIRETATKILDLDVENNWAH